jgi:HSP20 family protein
MSTLTKSEKKQVPAANGQRTAYITPLANILDSNDGYILEAEMPGVNKDGLEVTVENGQLQIFGRRAQLPVSGKEVYRESRALDYRRVFELDPSIDSTRITAKIEQGVLRLHLPKAESVKPRKISVS